MSLFWPSKARKEKLRLEREQLVSETTRQASLETRMDIMRRLQDFTSYISERTFEWQSNVEIRVRNTIYDWFASKKSSVCTQLAERFKARIAEMNSQNLSGLLAKHADAYRQDLIVRFGQETAEVFRKQTNQRLADVLLALRKEMDTRRGPVSTGNEALPHGTRFFFQRSDGRQLYIIEQPPMVRTIRFGEHGRPASYRDYQLAFPFIIFCVNLGPEGCYNMHTFFRSSPLTNLSDEIFVPALPNLERDTQRVCFAPPPPNQGDSVAKRVSDVINVFWGSGFNLDWSANYARYQRDIPEIATIDEWQKRSKANPQFILSVPWTPAKSFRTIGEFAQAMIAEKGEGLGFVSIESAEQKVAAVSERVSKDAMEAALKMIPKLSIEDAALETVTAALERTLRNSTGDIDQCLKEALASLSSGEPAFDDAFVTARRFRDNIMLEADRKVGWAGLVQQAVAAAA